MDKQPNLLKRDIITKSVIFCKEPFLYGHENYDQLVKDCQGVMDRRTKTYLQRYRLELDPHLVALIGRHSRKPWTKFINPDNQHVWLFLRQLISLKSCFGHDHKERPTAKEAMAHTYFYAIRNEESSRTRA